MSYNGQQQTCRYCTEYIHSGISCVQNKKLLVQKLATHTSSYADVAKTPNPTRPNTTRPSSSRSIPKGPSASKPSLPKQRQPSTSTSNSGATSSAQVVLEPIVVDSDGFLKPADVQGEENDNTWTRVARKSASQHKTDGNETDSSTSSRRSQRPMGKKMRCENSNETHDTDSNL